MPCLPRLVFFGSDAIALPALNWLVGAGASVVELVGVVSQPDRPAGRGQQLQANPIATWGRQRAIALQQPERPDAALTQWLRETEATVALVMAYGHLLRPELLAVPQRGFLNLHGSRLPALRGASPVETVVALGYNETAVSLMQVVKAMDAGPVGDFEPVTIGPDSTGGSVREALGAACVPLLTRSLARACAGELTFTPQDPAAATYCRKLQRSDGQLDFSQSAEVLARRIRALDPWPGCFAHHGELRLKLSGAHALPCCKSDGTAATDSSTGNQSPMPGTVLDPANLPSGDARQKTGLAIATGCGVLVIHRLQRPGGKVLDASDFLRGHRLLPGEVLTGGPMAPLVANSPKAFLLGPA